MSAVMYELADADGDDYIDLGAMEAEHYANNPPVDLLAEEPRENYGGRGYTLESGTDVNGRVTRASGRAATSSMFNLDHQRFGMPSRSRANPLSSFITRNQFRY